MVFNALRGVFLVLFLLLMTPVHAEMTETDVSAMDSVEISLLTCAPHDEVYSLYGHTAIRYHDLRSKGIDAAFNYGVFNFQAPFFALRFVFGITDYELGAYPYRYFEKEYRHFGSEVVEQVLNLTNEEKMQLKLALSDNLLPENVVYRYNFFYNNCTTKARDIIEQCINGKVEYADNKSDTTTYRKTVRYMTRNNPWSQFGNDLLLGIKADQPTTMRQQEFLPANLMHDFDHAKIRSNDGVSRPLVKERRVVVPAGTPIIQEGFPLSPRTCGIIMMIIGMVLFVVQYRLQRIFRLWDVLLMVLTGTLGIVLFLMLFSQHPTVSLNLQILLFNPLPWFYLWPVIKGRQTRYWTITFVLIILFIIGSIFQHYAEGLWCLALCLLLQSGLHRNILSSKLNHQ
jgi:hypothetical protein